MKTRMLTAVGAVFLAGLLALPVRADTTVSKMAAPGTLNYVEGNASIGVESLNSTSVGSAQLDAGETLTTRNGKAEVLLTPGVFLRVASNSAVKMISPDLTKTEVAVERGEAQVEVDQIFKQNHLLVREDGTTTQLQKRGLYDFNADQHAVRVLDGQASLLNGDQRIKIKGGHEVVLNAPKVKAVKFDKNAFESTDDLYSWSRLRSEYVAEANASQAPTYILNGWYGPGWLGAGWYWDPFFGSYTFIPANGILYSPFGWGFYSPYWAYTLPAYGYYRPYTNRPTGTWGHLPPAENVPVRPSGGIGWGHAGAGFPATQPHAGGSTWGGWGHPGR